MCVVSSNLCDGPPDAGWGPLRACAARLGAPGCGWGTAVVSAAALLVLVALGVALSLILQRESPRKAGGPPFQGEEVILSLIMTIVQTQLCLKSNLVSLM